MDEDAVKELIGWVPSKGNPNFRKVQLGSGNYLQIFIPLKGFPAYVWVPLQGRPDLTRPYGRDTFLSHLRARLEEFKSSRGTDEGFVLAEEDMEECRREILDFYRRRRFLLEDAAAAREFEVVIKDAQHALELMSMLERYCPDRERVWGHRQYEPYIRSHMIQAQAVIRLQERDYRGMVATVKDGIRTIKDFDERHAPWEYDEIHESIRPQSLVDHLQQMTVTLLEESQKKAIEEEDYETAAVIRDLRGEFEEGS